MENTVRYIDALLNGEDAVIKEIYKKLFPKVSSYVLSNNGTMDDAHDVFHDALMYIILTQKEKRTEIQSFDSYLFVVCKNIWLKMLKNRVIKSEVVTLVDNAFDLSVFTLEQQCFDFYLKKFGLLSENCKDILASYFNGSDYDELLEEFAYATINTIRQRVFKCRSKLIELIKNDSDFQKMIKWGQL